jgi:hypothetical protein
LWESQGLNELDHVLTPQDADSFHHSNELVLVHLYQVIFYSIGTLPLVWTKRALRRQPAVYFPNVSLRFLKPFKGMLTTITIILLSIRNETMLAGRLRFLGACI